MDIESGIITSRLGHQDFERQLIYRQMSTVIEKNDAQAEATSSDLVAPKTLLKNTYLSVIKALQSGSKFILITGDQDKGKTALVHTINKDISKNNRTITLSGKDLPLLNKSDDSNHTELENIKDFILESTDLEDKLVVILDDAHCLPISFLGALVSGIKQKDQQTDNLQLVLSGPLNFKDQLLAIEQINAEDLVHFPIDNLSNEAILDYIKSKTYRISSNIKQLDFDLKSLKKISGFIQSDQQQLDVILEWCAAIVKKDQLSQMSSKIVGQATNFAQQFSKDKNLPLSNAYPPSHEVYKYINDVQRSSEPGNKNIKSATKRSVKKVTTKKSVAQKVKKPSATKNINHKVDDHQHNQPSENILKETKRDEVIASRAVDSIKQDKNNNKLFFAATGLIAIVIISFISFTAFQTKPDPNQRDQSEQIAVNQTTPGNEPNTSKLGEQDLSVESSTKTEAVDLPVKNSKEAIIEIKDQNLRENTPSIAAISPSEKVNKIDASAEPELVSQIPESLAAKSTHDVTKAAKASKGVLEEVAIKRVTDPAQASEQTKLSTEKETETQLSTEVSDLLLAAKLQFDNKQLSTPDGDNALETYQKILAKYPDNKEAIAGIQNVHDKYVSWGNHYLKGNELNRAKNFYNKALGIDPSNTFAITKLQTIAQLQAAGMVDKDRTSNEDKTRGDAESDISQVELQAKFDQEEIQSLLASANEKMQQINVEIGTNKRNYKTYQEVQTIYQEVLRSSPQNQQALSGLMTIKKHYADWAELQVQSKNYNIALFLYGQALSLEPQNPIINQRIEQIRTLKKAL